MTDFYYVSYNQVFGTPYTIIRPSALYGERCVSRRVVQVFIEKAIEGAKSEAVLAQAQKEFQELLDKTEK